MKQISDPQKVTANNAWGRSATHFETKYEIELHDVGIERDHHGGYRHRRHTFTHADIGKTITVYNDGSGWTCWTF